MAPPCVFCHNNRWPSTIELVNLKKAEIEMRKKLDKVAEVKRLSNIIRGIQTEISKQEEKLSELKRYRMFIDQLTPAKYRKSKKKPEQARSVTSETSSGLGSKSI